MEIIIGVAIVAVLTALLWAVLEHQAKRRKLRDETVERRLNSIRAGGK